MKDELKNKLPHFTLIASIVSLAMTLISFVIPLVISGIVLGVIGATLSILCICKNYKKVGRVGLICSITSIIIEFVFVWMYLSAN